MWASERSRRFGCARIPEPYRVRCCFFSFSEEKEKKQMKKSFENREKGNSENRMQAGPPLSGAGLPFLLSLYSMMLVTTPEPTVRPPSRMANRSPCSIAIGVISLIVIRMLSPGMTISTPSGSSIVPVTSVVRK